MLNFQSPINATAAAANSFVVSANAAGLPGNYEFITFDKFYTGPQTLPASNVENKLVALTNDNRSTTEVTTILDRLSSGNKTYTHIKAAKDKATLTGAFTMDVTSATSLGTYEFTINIGGQTGKFTVVVEAPTQTVELLVSNTTVNTMLAPNATNQYIVNLNAAGSVEMQYALRFRNMQSTTNLITYNLTRTYEFGTVKWSDSRTLAFTGTALPGNDGHLYVTPTDAFTNLLYSQTSPEQIKTGGNIKLTFAAPGTYTYRLQIGAVVRQWSVVVRAFPTISINAAFLGDADGVNSGPQSLVYSSHNATSGTFLVIETRTLTGADTTVGTTDVAAADRVFLEVEGINLGTGAIYYQVSDNLVAPSLTVSGDALAAQLVDFDAETGLALISMTAVQLGQDAAFTADQGNVVRYVHLYNASKQAIGRVKLTTRTGIWA
jgi:hypothetical protein